MSSASIQTQQLRLSSIDKAKGLVVVIDVVRAFSTAAVAFANGANKIILTGSVEQAFQLHVQYPHALLMGESYGERIPGFHFGNSPVELAPHSFKGKTIIQRTSSGTQGVVRCPEVECMLISSFMVAEATLQFIRRKNPQFVTFLITGQRHGGHEDAALADYLADSLKFGKISPEPYLERVLSSPIAQNIPSDPKEAALFRADLKVITDINRYAFAMEVAKESQQLIAKPVLMHS